jgi:ATP-dependent helicase HrpA
LRLDYDPALPITAHRAQILEALARHPVIIVCGATGSGKSTQLPKLCLEAGRARAGLIGHTQPRRIAARALASRLAQELGTSLADAVVGYQVRFTDRTGPATRVKLMTDGILLKELESDPRLLRYDTLIIDEAHERSLNIDLLLGVLKQLSTQRPDLRLLITSATIDPGRFAEFFGGAPVIEVSGRSYPVEIRYRPLAGEPLDGQEEEAAAELSLPQAIVAAIRELDANDPAACGDTLVFLPGEKDIREAAEALREEQLRSTEILPLFARLSTRDQERIFTRHTLRRIVLATNVAETSLTVPGIRSVIDSGLARISRYSVRGKVQRLPIERISKASADQRRGRCGREAPGVCIRLYSEEDFLQREDFTPPEVLRTNLASVILRMAVLRLGEPESFPFLDAPDARLVNDGVRLLQELKAMDEQRRVTSLGEKIASLPVDPRLGRMLLAASHHRCVTEVLAVSAFLEAQDPRERPQEAAQQAAQKHAAFADARSDFLSIVNLWRAYEQQSQALSGNQLRKWCRENFLSFVRMREWQELRSQLRRAIAELRLRPNQIAASYAQLHQAILTGFLGSVGELDERREYTGPRGIRFVLAPGTPLHARPPHWVVAGSLLETTRLYARMVAAVEPGWIEAAGAHLVKRQYSEPHWVARRGFVAAYESVSLYGLLLVARRRINYGAIAPLEARDIFIREALIAETGAVRGDFLVHNRRLRSQVEDLEARIRRRDILVDEQSLVDFYAQRLPERISSVSAFEHGLAGAERLDAGLLRMSLTDLMRRDAPDASRECFPDSLPVGPNRVPLRYEFKPGEPGDGVTVVVPELLVSSLRPQQLDWPVPGLRLEKITAILRALPKAIRKQLVPVPDSARVALKELPHTAPPETALPSFYDWLASWVSHRAGAKVCAADLRTLELPPHLRMNVRVLDSQDRVVAEGHDLTALKRRLQSASGPLSRSCEHAVTLHRQWDFGELAESATVTRNGLELIVFPALEDRGSGVAVLEVRAPEEANAITRTGMIRLAMLLLPQQAKYVMKRMADDRALVLLSGGLPIDAGVAEALTHRSFGECFFPSGQEILRTGSVFAANLDQRRAQLSAVADRLAAKVVEIFTQWRAVRTALQTLGAPAFAAASADMTSQLEALLPGDFIRSVPYPWFDHLPRYLGGIQRRIERLPSNARRDAELAAKVRPSSSALANLMAERASAVVPAELAQLRWMIEEFRISLFAQDLKTALRVSENRLADQLAAARSATGS